MGLEERTDIIFRGRKGQISYVQLLAQTRFPLRARFTRSHSSAESTVISVGPSDFEPRRWQQSSIGESTNRPVNDGKADLIWNTNRE